MTCHRRPEPFIIKEKNDREEKKSTKKKVLREDVGGDCSQLEGSLQKWWNRKKKAKIVVSTKNSKEKRIKNRWIIGRLKWFATKDREEQGAVSWSSEQTAKVGILEFVKKEEEVTTEPQRETTKKRSSERPTKVPRVREKGNKKDVEGLHQLRAVNWIFLWDRERVH